ncbi:hypothetical protein D4S03_04770 [bacterium]|nr:MAG: hypothetical protein D4S03_04770 [bacterium]
MDAEFKERFLQNWTRYFPGAELPIGFYYSNSAEPKFMAKPPKGHRCIIGDIAKVRKGKTLCFDTNTIGCGGGKRYLGFERKLAPNFEYFLSYGIPGKLGGERYKKSPELVKEHMKHQKPSKAPGDYIIFKRIDRVEEEDKPLVAVFFAPPDVLSGLFTLANFDERQPNGVIAPFCAGCGSIVDFPLKELRSSEPCAVLGMFDVSARPCVPSGVLTFAVPWRKFVRMVDNMKESFLITKSWNKVMTRMKKDG